MLEMLYFIKDEFFDIFKDYKLMENKENRNICKYREIVFVAKSKKIY